MLPRRRVKTVCVAGPEVWLLPESFLLFFLLFFLL